MKFLYIVLFVTTGLHAMESISREKKFISAVIAGQSEIVKELISSIYVNTVHNNQSTALMEAAARYQDITAELLKYADPYAIVNGESALTYAIRGNIPRLTIPLILERILLDASKIGKLLKTPDTACLLNILPLALRDQVVAVFMAHAKTQAYLLHGAQEARKFRMPLIAAIIDGAIDYENACYTKNSERAYHDFCIFMHSVLSKDEDAQKADLQMFSFL